MSAGEGIAVAPRGEEGRLPVPSSRCRLARDRRVVLGALLSSGQCSWSLFISRYLILFRNELIHCFKNILRHCKAIISVLNGIKTRAADAFAKAKENIYLVFTNTQKKQSMPGQSQVHRKPEHLTVETQGGG